MLPWKLAIVIRFTFLIIHYCNSAESTATIKLLQINFQGTRSSVVSKSIIGMLHFASFIPYDWREKIKNNGGG